MGTLCSWVRGYDDRVNFGKFEPDASGHGGGSTNSNNWSNTDRGTRWPSERPGCDQWTGGVGVVVARGAEHAFSPRARREGNLDALVLLIPHWLTGARWSCGA